MDILIPDEWLREYISTKATPKQIAKYVSLCGPSVERINESKDGPVYSIEVTTNRVDAASIYGIAREAAVILPRFGLLASLKKPKLSSLKKLKATKVLPLEIRTDKELTNRVMAVVFEGVEIQPSPDWMKKRLEASGVRSLNNIIDITNYVMLATGHPTHVFDYDLITERKLIFRRARIGEQITTLDEKTYTLKGGEIVIDDGAGKIIDLPSIMGTKNSVVNEKTKKIIFFIDNLDAVSIRNTSMSLGIRTTAAMLNEKGVDPHLADFAFNMGVELYTKLAKAKPASRVYDIFSNPSKPKNISVSINFINSKLGVNLSKPEISKTLKPLDFEPRWKGERLEVTVPTFRIKDVSIPEDIVEEVARIYGYFNLPSELPEGKLPEPLFNAPFPFEEKLKGLLSGWGGVEIYTSSLVSEGEAGPRALKLKNPLGKDSEYLRTSLMPSLIRAAMENSGIDEAFHLHEESNIYIPVKGNLPIEKMTLAGIFASTDFRMAKGIIEALLEKLHINTSFDVEDANNFLPSKRLVIKKGGQTLGEFGVLTHQDFIYYEFDVETLRKEALEYVAYKPIAKYPTQIEDMTLIFPAKTKIGEAILHTKKISDLISEIKLIDIYKNSFTFRVWYQHPTKTLTDKEVETVRNKITSELMSKFGANQS